MGNDELNKYYSPKSLLHRIYAREAELEKIEKEHLEMMMTPTREPFITPHTGFPLIITLPAEDLFALRIKRNKKHYKPKFTL